jgi:hypothetical protein
MKVKVQIGVRPVTFDIPEELKNDPRLKATRKKTAFLKFSQRMDLEARKKWRENVKRRREEREAEEAPLTSRRWSGTA